MTAISIGARSFLFSLTRRVQGFKGSSLWHRMCIRSWRACIFIELLLVSGCHVFVWPLQVICQESNALSGLAKFKSQSKCLMRCSGKVGRIPANCCDVLSEEARAGQLARRALRSANPLLGCSP